MYKEVASRSVFLFVRVLFLIVLPTMPMLQAEKKKLAKEYLAQIDSAVNGVVLSYNALPVNELNSLRMDVATAGGQLVAIKKRVFLK